MYRINPDYNELVTTVLTVVARDTHYKNYLNIQFPVIVFIYIYFNFETDIVRVLFV